MAAVVYYRSRSEKEFSTVAVPAAGVSVADLKRLIKTSGRYGRGGAARGRGPQEDMALSNAQTGEDYIDESTLIRTHSSVLVRRIPGLKACTKIAVSSPPKVTEGSLTSTDFDEDAAIRAVIDAAELKWDDQSSGQHGWRSMQWRRPVSETSRLVWTRSGRIDASATSGRSPAEGKAPPPPPGYVCRRCQVPGHFIQHCPTNGDPRFDFGRMGRAVAVVPTVSAGEVDGIPVELLPAAAAAASVRVPDNLPPEQKVTADAALTNSCDKGIKDYTSAHSRCVCGASAKAKADRNPPRRSTITIRLAASAGSAPSGTAKPQSSSAGSSSPAAPREATAPAQAPTPQDKAPVTAQGTKKRALGDAQKTQNPTAAEVTEKAKKRKTTKKLAEAVDGAAYGYNVPLGPSACYNPYYFGCSPWGADPSYMYAMAGTPCPGYAGGRMYRGH